MSDLIERSINRDRATVTLARPELHNAFNDAMIEEITRAFEALGRDPKIRVIVLAAAGKSFCAGADIHWMKRMVDYTFEENRSDADAMARMLRTIRECPKPVIARIQGTAFGGGVGLAAACDLAVAVETAKFCLSEVKLGIIPAVISPYVLEKIGPGHLRRYGLTAERFDAAEAYRIGLVAKVAGTVEGMDGWIDDIARMLCSNGPRALAAFKKTLAEVVGFRWDDVQAVTTRRIAELRASPEGQEGLKAFLEKRKPGWAVAD